VRHGATANNAEGRYTGQSATAMSALGERQVAALAERLASFTLDAIITSDLPRALATAQQIVAGHHSEVTLDPDLRELSLGDWEGLSPTEARDRDPAAFRAWQNDPLGHASPNGETITQLAERVRNARLRWRAGPPERTTLWVTHGGVISALLCDILGLDLSRRGRFRRDNASITEVMIENGTEVIARANDTAHLAALGADALAEYRQIL
jgi:broad specificity phosphatase PhoE